MLDTADRTCAVDADCRKISAPAACLSCESSIAVASSAVAGLQELVRAEIDQGLCRELDNRSCPIPVAICEPPDRGDALCITGTCTLVPPPEPG